VLKQQIGVGCLTPEKEVKVVMKNLNNLLLEEVPAGEKKRAGRNRTLTAKTSEVAVLRDQLLTLQTIEGANFINRTILADCFDVFKKIMPESVDLLILDPPYNLNKKFGANKFSRLNECAGRTSTIVPLSVGFVLKIMAAASSKSFLVTMEKLIFSSSGVIIFP
jgi:hypothetical protein